MKRKYSLFRSLVLTLLMTLPLFIGIAALVGFTGESWKEYKRYRRSVEPQGWSVYTRLVVLRDGTPAIEEQIRHENRYQQKMMTLEGVELPRDAERLRGIYLQDDLDAQSRRLRLQERLFTPTEALRPNPPPHFYDPNRPGHVWLFRESDQNAGKYYLVNIDRDFQQIERYFDRNGIRDDEPSAESSFSEPLGVIESDGVIVFQSGPEIVAIDFKNQSVTQISDDTALSWGFRKGYGEGDYRREVILVSKNKIQTIDFSGNEVNSYAVEGRRDVELFVTEDDHLLVKMYSKPVAESTTEGRVNIWTESLFELQNDGQKSELEQYTRQTPRSAPLAETAGMRAFDCFIGQTGLGIMFPGPGVLFCIESTGAYLASQYESRHVKFAENWQRIHAQSPWAFPMSAFLGVIAAYFCYRRQRRYQVRWTKTWTVFVFLFGPAGYLAWRWHREWPPPELVGVTREEFEGPAVNGLEVFA
ncbi:hypothetical protein Pan258_03960 [Symmachiella dynata]|uniref:hypothetical protein n=1 Tax=Symmachiella dynata TaxID=2527995 RepID=UPI00118D0529|nr:hypothetical protein [Symmachiella dynata]QDT46377.1 hypothetical protein Pan258_03960 [Symmachiella dynata]